jgi:hypothetical protein
MGTPARTMIDEAAHGLLDHVCHGYDGPGELADHAVPYLTAGLRLGQRAVIVTAGPERAFAEHLAAAAVEIAGAGSVEVVEFQHVYGRGFVDVRATLARVQAVLAAALEQGYSGLRAVGLLTEAARDPWKRGGFAAWEHAVGRWQSAAPVASACSYDRSVLGETAVHDLACLHPRALGSGLPVPFRLYFRHGRLVLDGEVDSFGAPLLRRAAAHVRPVPGERLVIDARGLTFVNHRGLEALVESLARPVGGLTLLGTNALPGLLRDRFGIGEDVLDVLPWVG